MVTTVPVPISPLRMTMAKMFRCVEVYGSREEGYRRLSVQERKCLPDPEKTKQYAPLFAAYKQQAERI